MDKDLKNKTLEELENIVAEFGQKRYLAKYIFTFIHTKDIAEISQITTLSKAFRDKLSGEGYYISQLKTVEKFIDPDGTIKYLFELADASRIETVLLFDDDRITLCVSTQVGCPMDCSFCATAKLKFKRNLTAGEIADQVNVIQKENPRITNVVYMGMGEPLMNFDNVVRSVRILNNSSGKNIGIRHLTVSTCGIAPAIEQLADLDIHPRIAVSLNAPTDSIRTTLMPINKKYPLESLIEAVKTYQKKTKNRVTFEYILIAGVNETTLHAQMLVKLLRGIKCNINLIEYNPHPGSELTAAPRASINRFKKVLTDAGIETAVRLKKGQTIKAACGQLGADRLKGKS